MSDDVRFSYHVDPVRRGRVITIARRLEGNEILFGFSVCKPTYWVIPEEPTREDTACIMHKVEGDRFTKKQGRRLAKGRLIKRPWRVTRMAEASGGENKETVTKLEHPMDSVRRFFAEGNVTMRDLDGKDIPCPDFVLRTIAYNEWDEVLVGPTQSITIQVQTKELQESLARAVAASSEV
jgi:hypothetical protein